MEVLRRYATEAPDQRAWIDTKPTFIVSWWCTIFAITIILFRISGRYVRTEKLYLEDGIMMVAIIPLLTRMAFVHVILMFGTNNSLTLGLSSEDVRKRRIGSQLVLFSRILYAAYLWAIKYSTSIFLRSLTGQIWQRVHHKLLKYLHIMLAVTFMATVVSDIAECQPFTHYWQVIPDPGPKCRQGYAQFFTAGILNIITNFALIIFPVPMILKSNLSTHLKLSVIIRLALPILCIFATINQLKRVVSHNGDQQIRSLLASLDILLTTLASNASVIGSLLQDKGYKKTKYKTPIYRDIPSRAPSSRYTGRLDSDEALMIENPDVDGKGAVMIALDVLHETAGRENNEAKKFDRGGVGSGLTKPEHVWAGDHIRVERAWDVKITKDDMPGSP
ncbi:hypothetical protein SS1G_05758 [Sclerotinia sclerotiorum 1980 UF-70]|uniref:Rhodopsin domain-containing protein n=2 Tax=Sclerotinia sclerotiorum (strain ATCC 18683 / 1980 / Ss-1) TaxID=665079 RepID=A7EKB1_SCLS1|nr:hypothetical protein SS1G_05758 [Sclerotinia sclerotiorum 1980 UF-70]APA09977.1 hypothetical protein sscle_05g047470 [Sclerotinia sclerotiorum 1980 UF-70]EDO03277.1 hypothetical protein SS1G_05758 [Sclerotinia sclerotiorum 1980 UF-70]